MSVSILVCELREGSAQHERTVVRTQGKRALTHAGNRRQDTARILLVLGQKGDLL